VLKIGRARAPIARHELCVQPVRVRARVAFGADFESGVKIVRARFEELRRIAACERVGVEVEQLLRRKVMSQRVPLQVGRADFRRAVVQNRDGPVLEERAIDGVESPADRRIHGQRLRVPPHALDTPAQLKNGARMNVERVVQCARYHQQSIT